MEELKFRACLYCRTEIAAGRPNNTNFCNGQCQHKFSEGMSREKYREAVDLNKLIPIRGGAVAPREKKAKVRYDNLMHKLCALSEYGMCSTVFATYVPTKKFCEEAHGVKYNDIKKQERKVAKRNGN